MKKNPEVILYAGSMYGALNQKGLVEIKVHATEFMCTPSDAKRFALSILEAADGAQSDEFIVSFFHNIMKLPLPESASMLREFRKHREAMENRNEG